jgi:molecular chaperone HscB
MNYFELYQIPISFQLNKALVKEKYFALSRKFHPDFYGNGTADEQAEALEMSSLVNKAFKTFSNLDLTIKYILELKGLLEEEEKYQLPNDFLMEMMDLNEQLDEADSNSKESIKNSISNYQSEIYQEVKSIIETENFNALTETDLLKVKEYYFKKKYLNRILESIKS